VHGDALDIEVDVVELERSDFVASTAGVPEDTQNVRVSAVNEGLA
jgi:hypothetical protein